MKVIEISFDCFDQLRRSQKVLAELEVALARHKEIEDGKTALLMAEGKEAAVLS